MKKRRKNDDSAPPDPGEGVALEPEAAEGKTPQAPPQAEEASAGAAPTGAEVDTDAAPALDPAEAADAALALDRADAADARSAEAETESAGSAADVAMSAGGHPVTEAGTQPADGDADADGEAPVNSEGGEREGNGESDGVEPLAAESDGVEPLAAESDGAEPLAADATEEEVAPPPADGARLESIIESVLFASDRPLSVSDFKRVVGERDGKRIAEALEALRERRAESGIQLANVAGGWQLRTHPANGAWVSKLVAGRPQRLSRAMMETLAIVAYRQPITRPEIDEIRGVDCGPVLRTLLDRSLIRVIGKKEEVGRPLLYGTTPEFLKTFSLGDLTELPTLREFHELGAEDRARVDSEAPRPDDGGAAAAAPGAAAATRAPDADLLAPGQLPSYDPGEEDALIEELERASAAAGRATRAPTDPEPPAPTDVTEASPIGVRDRDRDADGDGANGER